MFAQCSDVNDSLKNFNKPLLVFLAIMMMMMTIMIKTI